MNRAPRGRLAWLAVMVSVLGLLLVFAGGYMVGAPLAIAAICMAAVAWRRAPGAASLALAVSVVALFGPVVWSAFYGQ